MGGTVSWIVNFDGVILTMVGILKVVIFVDLT